MKKASNRDGSGRISSRPDGPARRRTPSAPRSSRCRKAEADRYEIAGLPEPPGGAPAVRAPEGFEILSGGGTGPGGLPRRMRATRDGMVVCLVPAGVVRLGDPGSERGAAAGVRQLLLHGPARGHGRPVPRVPRRERRADRPADEPRRPRRSPGGRHVLAERVPLRPLGRAGPADGGRMGPGGAGGRRLPLSLGQRPAGVRLDAPGGADRSGDELPDGPQPVRRVRPRRERRGVDVAELRRGPAARRAEGRRGALPEPGPRQRRRRGEDRSRTGRGLDARPADRPRRRRAAGRRGLPLRLAADGRRHARRRPAGRTETAGAGT